MISHSVDKVYLVVSVIRIKEFFPSGFYNIQSKTS